MNNERIDLTQFENMEDNRPWSASWYPAEEEVEPDFLIEGGAEGHKVRIVSTQGGITLAYIANGSEVLANQIAKLPTLIAELKRCYEELDSQRKTISELIEANTVKGEILDELRVCDECGEGWDYHPSGANCEADRQQASE